jgi:peptidoglycan/LPS O-acetylase OafA/YrhL
VFRLARGALLLEARRFGGTDEIVLLVAAVLIVLAASFTYGREREWWPYGPVSLVIGAPALVVAGSDGGRPRVRPPHRTVPTH